MTRPDGLPVQLADPSFVPGQSHGFPEFQQGLDAVLMGRSTFEPALGADRWPWPELRHQLNARPVRYSVEMFGSASTLSGTIIRKCLVGSAASAAIRVASVAWSVA